MFRKLIAAAAAMATMSASASATLLVFEGEDNNVVPLGVEGVDFDDDCASNGDFCSVVAENGLVFTRGGLEVQVRAYADGVVTGEGDERMLADIGDFARVIQDRNPGDSGLGAFSEVNSIDDQTQFDSGESIEFIFDRIVAVNDIEFNAGGDVNCTTNAEGAGEGPCGEFLLQVFDLDDMLVMASIIDISNIDVLDTFGVGARFLLTALTEGAGFSIARFNVVPVPGALPLLLSGIAGLVFASRRKRKTA